MQLTQKCKYQTYLSTPLHVLEAKAKVLQDQICPLLSSENVKIW